LPKKIAALAGLKLTEGHRNCFPKTPYPLSYTLEIKIIGIKRGIYLEKL